MSMPKQKPGRSEQSVQTPTEFMAKVAKKFGKPVWDLAADEKNTQCGDCYFDENNDSLKQDWSRLSYEWNYTQDGHFGDAPFWLNPPYKKIRPWVKKAVESDARILVLVPASVGSNWWRDHVHDQCLVHFLNGRITFVGHKAPFPKDLALLEYNLFKPEWSDQAHGTFPTLQTGYRIWSWNSS